MKIHKITKLDVGNGGPGDIYKALQQTTIPSHAVATKIEVNYENIFAINVPIEEYKNTYLMTFEWDDEE
jgi:hypothetical protein